jgi:carbon-monoxide dehydrogenase small subunit
MAAKAMLDENSNRSEEEFRAGLSGNVCRCTGYSKIVEAVLACAEKMK